MKVLFFSGIPGSGKSSVARGLSSKYSDIYHLSIGDHLRSIIDNTTQSKYAEEVKANLGALREAKPLDNELIQLIILEYIEAISSTARLLIIEPYPRTVSQVEPLIKELRKRDIEIVGLLKIEVDHQIAVDRVVSRGNRKGEVPATNYYAQERAERHIGEVNELLDAMSSFMPIYTIDAAATVEETVESAENTIPYSFTQS